MPTHEAVVSTIAPKPEAKPIPTRTVTTRTTLRTPTPQQPEPIADQASTSRSESGVEDSTPAAESVRLSPQLSALARKEQAFRQREQALKTREQELEAKLADADQYSQLKSKLSSKDYSEAERLGLNYEGYTQYLIDKQAGEDPQVQALKKLESEIEALKKGNEDKATQEYDDTVAEYRKEIDSLISSKPEFRVLKKAEATEGILQSILDLWELEGLEMDIEEAAGLAKQVLLERAKASAALLEDDAPPVEEERKLPPPRVGSKTLTQNVAAVGTDKKPQKSLQFLSEAERYEEARRRVLERQKGNN